MLIFDWKIDSFAVWCYHSKGFIYSVLEKDPEQYAKHFEKNLESIQNPFSTCIILDKFSTHLQPQFSFL